MRGSHSGAAFVGRSAVLFMVAALAGCEGGGTEPPIPLRLEAVTATELAGTVGMEVQPTPVVLVTDEDGTPLAGVAVYFAVGPDGGTLAFSPVETGVDGLASVGSWTLGIRPGRLALAAWVAGVVEPVRFVAAAQPGPVEEMWLRGGDLQVGAPGTELRQLLRIWAGDHWGNAVAGALATFDVVSGGGSIRNASVLTDPWGYAQAGPWTLGPEVGPQRVVARSGVGESAFDAYAAPPTSYTDALPPACATAPACGTLAFVSTRDGDSEIYSIDPDGTGLARLTNDAAADGDPAWSPDGQRLAFASDRSGSWEIYVMDADGNNVEQRTFAGGYSREPSWSPDGSRIAYSNGGDLWRVSGDTDGVEPIAVFTESSSDDQPTWSPDGTRLAFVSDWSAQEYAMDVFLIQSDGSGLSWLTDRGAGLGRFEYLNPAWSPDGERLALTIRETYGVDVYVARIGVMDSSGAGLRPLASAYPDAAITWSLDGEVIAYTSIGSDTRNISWITADGRDGGILAQDGFDPAWGP